MEIADQALAIIESYCGQSFTKRQVNERITLKNNIGRLTHDRILSIDTVLVRSSDWAYYDTFGATEWAAVNSLDVELSGKNEIYVPGGVLDTGYSEALVTYSIGYVTLPEPIAQARDLLMRRINGHSTYASVALITPEIAELINPFRNDGGDA